VSVSEDTSMILLAPTVSILHSAEADEPPEKAGMSVVQVDEVSSTAEEGDASSPIFRELISSLPATPEGRVLYVSRHGESEFNLENRIGGNPHLSAQGYKYARALASHVNAMNIPGLKVNESVLVLALALHGDLVEHARASVVFPLAHLRLNFGQLHRQQWRAEINICRARVT